MTLSKIQRLGKCNDCTVHHGALFHSAVQYGTSQYGVVE